MNVIISWAMDRIAAHTSWSWPGDRDVEPVDPGVLCLHIGPCPNTMPTTRTPTAVCTSWFTEEAERLDLFAELSYTRSSWSAAEYMDWST